MGLVEEGFEVIENILPQTLIESALSEFENKSGEVSSRGIRNAEIKFSFVQEVCNSRQVQSLVSYCLPGNAKLVRAIIFDKTPESNWLVTWHQDKTVAVSEKRSMPGWGPWSVKDGIDHVQPPIEVLESMITLRIHLDDAMKDNGCLKVVPNSEKLGIIEQSQIENIVTTSEVVFCEVGAGDAVLMRPHLLHASSKSVAGKHRRVLHLEYSNYQLASGLSWASNI